MNCVPTMRAKRLSEVEGGELVQISGGNGMVLGIVAETHFGGAAPSKVLICLSRMDEEYPPPRFMALEEWETMLSLGRDFALVPDPLFPAANAASLGKGANGALLVGRERTVLLVAPFPHSAIRGPIYYDVSTGHTVEGRDLAEQYAFTKWEIRLTPTTVLDPPLPAIYRFPASSPDGSSRP